MRLLLDTNVLMRLCHPKAHRGVKDWLRSWMQRAQEGENVEIVISAAADYELRRGYLWKIDKHPNEEAGLRRLNRLCGLFGVHPVTDSVLKLAARFWADARRGGYATASERDIDWDVIIAAQATDPPAVVVTRNTAHLTRYGVDARDWDAIQPPGDTPT